MKKYLFLEIILFALFLRFVNFNNRWGLGYDQASFALVGKYTADMLKIPLLGPFSSSGPFQTGGQWYWLVALGHILFPGIIVGPWIFMGILSVVLVVAMMIVGTILEGTTLGTIVALLTAISTAQITQSTNLSNQTPIALFAALALIAAAAYQKSKKSHYLFFVGLAIGIASSIHLQGLGLIPLAVAAVCLSGFPSLQGLLSLGIGLLIPWLPVFLADSTHDWYNTKNMFYYYTIDQYRISLDVLGRRWLTFITQTLPNIWGFTIGGYWWMGAITMVLGFVLIRKKWAVIITSFIGLLFVARYTHVPLYDSFLVFFHPFILIITAGILTFFLRWNKKFGFILILLVLIPTMTKNIEEITHSTNLSAREAKKLQVSLTAKFPDTKFAVYDYQFQTAAKTLALLIYLDQKNLLHPFGYRIGVSNEGISDLQSSTSAELSSAHWAYLDDKVMYESVQNWWNK